jgi:hypothetical protein
MAGLTWSLGRQALVAASLLILGGATDQWVERARAQNYPGGHFTLANQHNHTVANQDLAASICSSLLAVHCVRHLPADPSEHGPVIDQLGEHSLGMHTVLPRDGRTGRRHSDRAEPQTQSPHGAFGVLSLPVNTCAPQALPEAIAGVGGTSADLHR